MTEDDTTQDKFSQLVNLKPVFMKQISIFKELSCCSLC